jgi:hypothetical protein
MATPTCYVSVGDTHLYDHLGLMPKRAPVDFGCTVEQSEAQAVVYAWWNEFHKDFIPWATQGEPYVYCHGGDMVDGLHHRNTTHSTADYDAIIQGAVRFMAPYIEGAAAYYQLAGTPAHDGAAWWLARAVARELGAPEVSDGNHIRPELDMPIGDGLIHDTHHVSTTGLQKSMVNGINSDVHEQLITRAKLGKRIPEVYLRHHCHFAATAGGFLKDPCREWVGRTVPGWQLKGDYPWKVGARNHETHYGGLVVRWVTHPWSKGRFELLPYTRCAVPAEPIVLDIEGVL